PCEGFAYGEQGKLYLVRTRNSHKIDQLDLGRFFEDVAGDYPGYGRAPGFAYLQGRAPGFAYLQRWSVELKDYQPRGPGERQLVPEIERRPPTEVMHLADYNRDGAPTKFLLQVDTLPCGKREFVAVGVTQNDRELHALTSA